MNPSLELPASLNSMFWSAVLLSKISRCKTTSSSRTCSTPDSLATKLRKTPMPVIGSYRMSLALMTLASLPETA